MLRFDTTINNMLGTSATSWSQLNFTEARVKVKSRDKVPKDGYQIAISSGNPYLGLDSGNVAAIIDGTISWSGKADMENVEGSFDFLSLFKKLSRINPTIVTPNTTPWYICIKNEAAKGATRRFNRRAYYESTVTVSGGYASNINYYTGSEWKQCIPYYYNGSEWKQCLSNYWTGSEWKQT